MDTAKSNLVGLLLITPLLCFACSVRSADNNAQANRQIEIESTIARKYSRIGFVNDFANVLTPEETERLNAKAKDLLNAKEVDAAIVTVPSLDGETIENASLWLGRAWKVGAGKKGVVLCLAIADRQSRIDVTRNLEGILTNEACSLMLQHGRRWFAEGQYGRGSEEIIESIRKALETEKGINGASTSN